MPVIHIKALPQKHEDRVKTALEQTCLTVAQVYGCEPNQVWATWEEIKPGYYTEGDQSAQSQPMDTHPPLVELICFEGKTPDQIEHLLLMTSKTLTECLGLGENIFITYKEAKSGQVVAGNGVVRK